ncbi:hypothetical protein FGIG_11316, partial [Fasciola gigantica]
FSTDSDEETSVNRSTRSTSRYQSTASQDNDSIPCRIDGSQDEMKRDKTAENDEDTLLLDGDEEDDRGMDSDSNDDVGDDDTDSDGDEDESDSEDQLGFS